MTAGEVDELNIQKEEIANNKTDARTEIATTYLFRFLDMPMSNVYLLRSFSFSSSLLFDLFSVEESIVLPVS